MKYLVHLILFSFTILVNGQNKNTVLVEHFTNTPCPICATNNPKVYRVIDRYLDQVHHISIHTDSPYPSCELHLFNPEDNGARQDYYGAHSTPRVYVNGKLSSASQEARFEQDLQEALAVVRPLAIRVNGDSGNSTRSLWVDISSLESLEISQYRIFVAIVEKIVNYNAPNGETVHRDVLRDYVTASGGDPVTLPLQNESITLQYDIIIPPGVAPNESYVMVYVQDINTKQIMGSGIQSETATPSIDIARKSGLRAFPNPVQDLMQLNVNQPFMILEYEIVSITGASVIHRILETAREHITVNTQALVPGNYLLKANLGHETATIHFVKK